MRLVRAKRTPDNGHGLGTFSGVFTPSILTILGIILFLRLGYVIGGGGLARAFMVMAVAHALALLTSISLAAISTNLRVGGGGVYYLISRSLGAEFGGALGILLFVAQSVSIAFYCVGFGEATTALFVSDVQSASGFVSWVPRLLAFIAAAAMLVSAWLGLDWANRLQFVIMGILACALASFAVGAAGQWSGDTLLLNWFSNGSGLGFWALFALFFPAVTGFTQGASLSGDLRRPERSLPLGVLGSVVVAGVVYFATAVLLAGAVPNALLVRDYEAMRHVSRIGFLIDAGVIAAALSSALASFLGAPRILQSLAQDRLFPFLRPFARSDGPGSNPRRGLVLSGVIAFGTIAVGNLNVIAPVVSMFFLISYGLLNYATYVEAHGASPSFRPRFRWFHARLSLLGALGCLGAMLAIDAVAGAVALAVLFIIQQYLSNTTASSRWTDGRRSYHFQRMRETLLALRGQPEDARNWRPRLLTFALDPLHRDRLLRFAGWIEGRAGLNTLVHFERGDPETAVQERQRTQTNLALELEDSEHDAFALSVTAPDPHAGLQLLLQAHGMGTVRDNTVLVGWDDSTLALEPTRDDAFTGSIQAENGPTDVATDRDSQSSRRPFEAQNLGRDLRTVHRLGCNAVLLDAKDAAWWGLESTRAEARRIDVWWRDDATSRLMLLLAYLVTRDREWNGATIRVLAPRTKRGAEKTRLSVQTLLRNARINAGVEVIVEPNAETVVNLSADASLVLLPFEMQGKRLLDPFGNRPTRLARRLPLVAMVRAAQEIDLEADPEDGHTTRLVVALDRARDSVERARNIEKRADRARLALERKRRALQLAPDTDGAIELAKLEQEVHEAESSADRLERQVRRAQRTAARDAVTVQDLCSDSPRTLRDTADELAESTRDWRADEDG